MNSLSEKDVCKHFSARQKAVRLHRKVFVSLCKVLCKNQIEKILPKSKIVLSMKQNRGLAPLHYSMVKAQCLNQSFHC